MNHHRRRRLLVIYLKTAAWVFVLAPIYLFIVPKLLSAPSTISVAVGLAIIVFGLPVAIYLTFNENLFLQEKNNDE